LSTAVVRAHGLPMSCSVKTLYLKILDHF